MRAVMLVPRRVGDPHRDRVWEKCRENWSIGLPHVEIVEGHHNDGLFNRAAATNAAAASAGSWDVAVVVDADVQTSLHPVRKTMDIALATDSLVLGFDERHHVSLEATERWMAGDDIELADHVDRVEHSIWSGMIGVSRKLWEEVGGFDEEFTGYGFEDIAFVFACWAAMKKPHVCLSNVIYHLWHPPAAPPSDDFNYVRNEYLCGVYRAAAEIATGLTL